jgi:hypothetical protein
MRWLHFYQAFSTIRSLSNELRHTSIRNLHALGLAKHIDICRNTSDYKDMGLVDLVVNVRTMSATNPKDKIYALLGMIDDRWSYKPKFSVLASTGQGLFPSNVPAQRHPALEAVTPVEYPWRVETA